MSSELNKVFQNNDSALESQIANQQLAEAEKNFIFYENLENGVLLPLANGVTVTFEATGVDAGRSVDSFGHGLLKVNKKDKDLIKAIESHPKFLDAQWDEVPDEAKVGKTFYRKLTSYELKQKREAEEAKVFVKNVSELLESEVLVVGDLSKANQEQLFRFANKCGISAYADEEQKSLKTKADVAKELRNVLGADAKPKEK